MTYDEAIQKAMEMLALSSNVLTVQVRIKSARAWAHIASVLDRHEQAINDRVVRRATLTRDERERCGG